MTLDQLAILCLILILCIGILGIWIIVGVEE